MSAADFAKLSFNDNENVVRMIEYVNFLFKDEAKMTMIPIAGDKDSLAKACVNGDVIAKLLLKAKADLFDIARLNVGATKGFQVNSNQALVIESLKEIGFKGYEGLKPANFEDPDADQIAEIVERVIKRIVFDPVNQKAMPDLAAIAPISEKKKAVAADSGAMARVKVAKKASVEQLVLRWANQQLRHQCYGKVVASVGDMDVRCWAHLVRSLAPTAVPREVLTMTDADKQADAVIEALKTLELGHFVTKKELMEKNEYMFTYLLALAVQRYPLFSKFYNEKLDKVLAEAAGENQNLSLWVSAQGRMYPEGDVIELFKDHVSIFHVLDVVLDGKVDWTKVNQIKVNQFKAQDNWKQANEMICALTRFPPRLEIHDLSSGSGDKIKELVDVVYAYDREETVKATSEADLLAWANALAEAGAGSAAGAIADVSATYIGHVLKGLDAGAGFFVDAAKLGDDASAAAEVVQACWKFGVHTSATPAQLAAKDAKAMHIMLGQMKEIFDMAC